MNEQVNVGVIGISGGLYISRETLSVGVPRFELPAIRASEVYDSLKRLFFG